MLRRQRYKSLVVELVGELDRKGIEDLKNAMEEERKLAARTAVPAYGN